MSKVININVFKSSKKNKEAIDNLDRYIKVIDLAGKALSFYGTEKLPQKIISTLLYFKSCAMMEKAKLQEGKLNEKI